jgi:hypothetical protein
MVLSRAISFKMNARQEWRWLGLAMLVVLAVAQPPCFVDPMGERLA